MAYTPPGAYYSTSLTGTYIALTGIQSINITRGRQRATDPFQGSQCVVELIPANTYATPLEIGQFFDVRATNSAASPALFAGRITDVQRTYGIPYNASNTIAAPADRIIITATGGTGVIGNQDEDGDITLTAGQDAIFEAASESAGGAGVDNPQGYGSLGSRPSGVNVSAAAYPAGTPVLEVINDLLRTAQWTIDDADLARSNAFSSYNFGVNFYPVSATGTTITFQDTSSANYRYSGIEYLSSIQQAFSTVVVQPDGLATQSATSGNLRNTYTFRSVDQTTTQAANLAAYVLLVSNQTTPAPFAITTSTAVADGVDVLARFTTYPVGTNVQVIFRGTTVYATVQGWNFGFYPDYANVTAYLSASLGTPFTLDSTSFGVLDTNRLGYP